MATRKPLLLRDLPGSIKVGSQRLRFRITSAKRFPEIFGCNGLCDYDRGLIYLERGFFVSASPTAAAEVVQHEVTHAINHVFGVADGMKEEKFTEQHTKGLVTVFHDNPQYARWFLNLVTSKALS